MMDQVHMVRRQEVPPTATDPHAEQLWSGQTPLTTCGLSVVLPAHNEEAVIAETVSHCEEVLSALAPDYEVIVVDDGSKDRTGEIADGLAAANPRVRVIPISVETLWFGVARSTLEATRGCWRLVAA